jgi:hypothetical protein
VCDNGHTSSLYDLYSAYLEESIWTPGGVGRIWPTYEAIQAVVKKVATPEFLRATHDEWQSRMTHHQPFLSWLIHHAEQMDRKSAATLKDFNEQRIRNSFPILGQYLDAVRAKNRGEVRIRERIFRSLGNWR